jgi:hypothetical protein
MREHAATLCPRTDPAASHSAPRTPPPPAGADCAVWFHASHPVRAAARADQAPQAPPSHRPGAAARRERHRRARARAPWSARMGPLSRRREVMGAAPQPPDPTAPRAARTGGVLPRPAAHAPARTARYAHSNRKRRRTARRRRWGMWSSRTHRGTERQCHQMACVR